MSILNELPETADELSHRSITSAAYGTYKNMEIPYHKMTKVTANLWSDDINENFRGVCAISEIRHTVSKSREYQLYIRQYSRTPLITAITNLENRRNMQKYKYSRFLELYEDPNYMTSLTNAIMEVKTAWNMMYKHHKPSKELLIQISEKEYNFTFSKIKKGPYEFDKATIGLAIIEETWMPFVAVNHHVYVKMTGEWELKYDILEPVTYIELIKT